MEIAAESQPTGWNPIANRRPIRLGLNSHNVSIGLTAVMFYAFSSTPAMFEATRRMGLTEAQSVSWYTGTFLTAALAGMLLSWRYKMPIPVGWSLPGLLFLSSASSNHTYGQLIGAVAVAGLVIMAIGLTGAAERLVELIPYPVAMGVFAGTIFGYVADVFDQMASYPAIIGGIAAGYFGALALRRTWFPPMAGALTAGVLASAALGEVHFDSSVAAWPQFAPVAPQFDPVATIGLAVPLVLMAIGMANLQGFAMLRGEGFDVPIRKSTIVMGIGTLVNAAFGGHVASLQTNGTAIMATPGAGPKQHRYVSTLIASTFALLLALGAGCVGALMGVVPPALIVALAGLAVMPALADSMRKAVSSEFPMGAFVAMMIATSSGTLLGIGAALWAFVGGLLVAFLVEGDALKRHAFGPQPAAA